MATNTPVIPPAGYEHADGPRRRHVEQYAASIVLNGYLKIAVLSVSAAVIALVFLNLRTSEALRSFKPLVIRVDEVGRATAVSYSAAQYQPQAPELKYFLIQFVTNHYSRVRATVRESFARSLYFMDARLADATIESNKKSRAIERFLTEGREEIDVRVNNVTLDDIRQPPYRATVDFDKVSYAVTDHAEIKRESFVGHFVFVLQDRVPNNIIPVNPLGLTITYFREDQAFTVRHVEDK
jgi:type IV secretory pathway TrbF-like protein